MDITKLKRDASYVKQTLVATPDGKVLASKGCKLYIPARYAEKNLALLGNENYILGIYALVVDGRYAVSKAACMIKIDPIGQSKVMVGDDEYLEFEFLPGSEIISNVNVVKEDTLLYHLFDYFVDGGYIPWFLDYTDIGTLFQTAEFYTGIRLGANRAVMEMIISTIARNPDNRVQYYRQLLQSQTDIDALTPAYVPYKSVLFGPKTTTAKLMGAYFDSALASALVNPSENTENIETLLRK